MKRGIHYLLSATLKGVGSICCRTSKLHRQYELVEMENVETFVLMIFLFQHLNYSIGIKTR